MYIVESRNPKTLRLGFYLICYKNHVYRKTFPKSSTTAARNFSHLLALVSTYMILNLRRL